MHDYDWLLLAAFSLLVLAPAPFLGRYFYRVMEGQRTWLSPVLQPLERQAKGLAPNRGPAKSLTFVSATIRERIVRRA